VQIMVKTAPPWPSGDCARECMGEIDEEIGKDHITNVHEDKIILNVSKVPNKKNPIDTNNESNQ